MRVRWTDGRNLWPSANGSCFPTLRTCRCAKRTWRLGLAARETRASSFTGSFVRYGGLWGRDGQGWTGVLELQGHVALGYEPGRVGWHLQVETNRGDSLPVPVVEETAEATAQLVPWCAL